ncbi:NYN domain-containing protein [Candidatus Pacearchaeota archaeon]|nr:NYN domain-containing protein [Candidatus Pacearchaeota archaeon]
MFPSIASARLGFIMKRVILFIDGSNFYYGLKWLYGEDKELSNFNFLKFGEKLAGKRDLIRVYYYNAPLDYKNNQEKYAKQQKFFNKITSTDKVKLILSRLQKRRIKGTNKFYYVVKGDYIHLASDIIRGAYEDMYDEAILVSGDGDFIPAIKIVQEKGKIVENAYFKLSLSWHLKQECDNSINLTKEILDSCFD